MRDSKEGKAGPLAALKAVFWAFFGIRKRQAHEEVSHLRPVHFVVAGLIGASLFVLALVALVRLITGKG
ncbi:DUF2970 domain-containing protein [Pelomicrobium sp. G1]|uniref:DUF2970 domain-containing protein n=1 Tax=unclassified Pelomicrobium TaxID=2815318 RepID=UPI0021DBAF4D|nr:MAG: hypothetical protein KatS3mg123_1689 [Burkholderiales bacterium]